jgi:hypothetical protein
MHYAVLGIMKPQNDFVDCSISAKKQKEKLDYMHANPVNHSLAKHPKDWPWSSWSFYFTAGPGLIGMDAVDF